MPEGTPGDESEDVATPDEQDRPPWCDDYAADEDPDTQIDEYDLTATPNDFNVTTIFNFIETGAVKIPGFQRNYVWDIRRASKLIESLILGLPVPQVFLYEEARNSFLVIDGQQRLMSIYYFVKGRFPRKSARARLRALALERGVLTQDVLDDDELFQAFALSLPEHLPSHPNKFKRKKYTTLGDYKTTLELRPIRNVIVKQNVPRDDDSSVYEMFNRLNTGGVNLKPQEIRASLYHSPFFETLHRINMKPGWRRIIGKPEPDLHAKDLEILLRSFALLLDLSSYKPSMVKFLNHFSKKCRKHTPEHNKYLESLFAEFACACDALEESAFINPNSRRLNVALYESVFYACCYEAASASSLEIQRPTAVYIGSILADDEWRNASLEATTDKANVRTRLTRAAEVLRS
ncbi:MAG: DUF262 domain-containing protein [Dehalococcoidia bacterium]